MKSINKFVTFLVAAFAAFAIMLGLASGASAENKQNDYRGPVSQGETRSADSGVVLGGTESKGAPKLLHDGNKVVPGERKLQCGKYEPAGKFMSCL